MLDYEKYEDVLDEAYEDRVIKPKKKLKKMKRPIEERNRGRKLNKRTKKNKAREY